MASVYRRIDHVLYILLFVAYRGTYRKKHPSSNEPSSSTCIFRTSCLPYPTIVPYFEWLCSPGGEAALEEAKYQKAKEVETARLADAEAEKEEWRGL